jgi:lysophospholipase L1-like esterase
LSDLRAGFTTLGRVNLDPSASGRCRLGVLAFGDSITNGGGELQWGVALQSWALWTARGLGLPYTTFAMDGATCADVLNRQIPEFSRRVASPDGRFELGCLYIGVNDVRRSEWSPDGFAASYEPALRFLGERCDRVLTATAPLGLGLPRAGRKVHELNEVVSATADRVGALVLDLSAFGARNQVMADRVHPTAFGQIAIAERALALLAADGMQVRAAPASMIEYRTSRTGRLRGDWTYAYRSVKAHGQAVVDLAHFRLSLAKRALLQTRAPRGGGPSGGA